MPHLIHWPRTPLIKVADWDCCIKGCGYLLKFKFIFHFYTKFGWYRVPYIHQTIILANMDQTHLDRPNDMPPMVVVHCPILLQHPCDHRSYCSSKTSLINWTVPIGSTCRPTSDHHCLMGSTRIYKLVPQLCTNFLFSPYPSILD